MATQPTRQAAAASEALKTLGDMSRSFERTMSDAFVKSAVQGKRFEDVLKSVGSRLQSIGTSAALGPLEALLGKAAGALTESLAGAAAGGIGSLLSGLGGAAQLGSAAKTGHLSVYARGGVLDGPAMFPMQGGAGLAGEAGPEAIMPLARGTDGRLGVRASGGTVQVTVNVTTPDADSFRRSEAQVTAALARAVARGQRGL
jgi:lambda family phage tail tape measure protein